MKFVLHGSIHRSRVKLLDEPEKLTKIITLVKICINILLLLNNLNEIAHNIRENSNPKQKHEYAHDSLRVTLWVIVAESNRRKACERKVKNCDGLGEL